MHLDCNLNAAFKIEIRIFQLAMNRVSKFATTAVIVTCDLMKFVGGWSSKKSFIVLILKFYN